MALANLRTRIVRTIATVASVMLAIASLVALIGLARGVENSLLAALDARQTDVVVTEKGAIDLISSIVSQNLSDKIGEQPGVAAVAAELTRVTSLDNGGSAIVVAWQIGSYPWLALDLTSGRLPQADEALVTVVGDSLARRYGLQVGDTTTLFQSEFQVIGIATSGSILTRNLLMIPLSAAQQLTYRQGQATSINVRIDPAASEPERQSLIARLRSAFPNHAVEGARALANNHTFAQIADVLSRSISVVSVLVAVFAIFNTMSMAVRERRGEIAIMNAVGWSRRRIVSLAVFEAMILSGTGGGLGCIVGLAAAHLVSRLVSISGVIEPAISPVLLGQAMMISILIGLVGAFVPAFQTASLSPATILRGK